MDNGRRLLVAIHDSLYRGQFRMVFDKGEKKVSLYVCGDTHADIDWGKLAAYRFEKGKKLSKHDYVLVCGDFGGVWDCGVGDKYIQRWYNSKPWTTLFIDGNHENHDALDAMPVDEWCGGKVHKVTDSIIHLMRGQIYDIDRRKIFTMGGADSIDKMYRKEGKSWWSREMPSEEEYEEALRNVMTAGRVDYVFTHTAPSNVVKRINDSFTTDVLTDRLELYSYLLDFKKWYFGHFHASIQVDIHNKKFEGLYNKDPIRVW